MLSLRLVSVLICVVLTMITAALTLAVSLSFTKKAVDDLGLRYSSSLANNLKHSVQDLLQGAASQYAGAAQIPAMSSRGLPNTTYTPGWNGSFWTYNPSDIYQLDRYYQPLTAIMISHNFTRESTAYMCFEDGSFGQVAASPTATFQYNWNTVAGSGTPIGPASYAYTYTRYWGYKNQLVFNSTPTVSYPTPWNMPTCGFGQPCSTFECRTRPQYLSGLPYGRSQCWWLAPFVSSGPGATTGVFCTMYNSLNQRLGVAGSMMGLAAVTNFVSSVARTANGQAFAVDSLNWGILGSTYSARFQRTWYWGNATYNAATNSFRNSSAFPITFRPIAPNVDSFAAVGAVSANATYVQPLPQCLVGQLSFAPLVVCQENIFTYGYAPLLTVHQQVGLDPSQGFRQGSIMSEGEKYYYALDGIATYANGRLLPGLLWTVVVLTPEGDVLGKVNQGRSYSIAATVSFFVFAAVCCFVLFTIFLRPLVELEDKMLMTANLADENDKDESVSSLSEVRNMQKSFYKLRTQLRRLKSYVPQSVLAAMDDDDDDGEGGAPSVGASTMGDRSVRVDDVATAKSSNAAGDERRSIAPSSRSSKKSGTHYTVSSGGQAVRLLNMQVGVVKKNVTVLVFNVVGLHAQLKTRSGEDFVRMHSKLVDNFHTVVAQEKGIVDSFQGDRFVATFNAVTNNAQHGVRACVAAQQLLAGAAKLKLPFVRFCVGVATGEAFVGNAGTETLRRFCTVGRVYTQATAMERLTKQFPGADVLISAGTAGQVRHEFYVEAVDVLMFEGSGKPALLFALRARMNHAMEEWNYAMLQNEAKDKYGAVNEAFAKFAEGDPSGARAMLAAAPETSRHNPGYERLGSILQSNAVPATYAATTQGRFFASSFVETTE